MKKLAFIGLGVMGYPMAGHLANAGYRIAVYNRTRVKAEKWVQQYAGEYFDTPAKAAENADMVLLCVGDDPDVREVMLGENGALAGAKKACLFVDHTTTSAMLAKALSAACANQECGFLDAPVSGGQAGAESGQLSIMLGGDEENFQRALPVLKNYGKTIRRIGEVGCGQQAKMMNQICIAGIVQGLAEALNFGQQAGLDCEKVIEVISGGAAQSWQMNNRARTMLAGEYDFGFAVDWMRKDLNIALQEARVNGSQLPLTALVDQFYAEVQKQGGGRWDTSSLLARLK